MTDNELERRVAGLFEEVPAPEGMHRWEVTELAAGAEPRHAHLVRLPRLRRADGRWGPLALAAGLSLAVGLAGAALGGVQLSRSRGGDLAGPGASAGPSGRVDAAMAYDSGTHEVVLFGGRDSSGQVLGDTWAWNGSTWRQLHPSTSPPARAGAGMAWDSTSGRLVLAGGLGMPETASGDAGTCNSAVCASVSAGACIAPSPKPQIGSACATVPLVSSAFDDTWTFDGQHWREEHPAHPAVAFVRASMASAPGGGVLLTGGAMDPAILACPPQPPLPAGARGTASIACEGTSTGGARVVRWDGHDWTDQPSIPGFNPRLVTSGDTILAVTGDIVAKPLPAPANVASPPCLEGVGVPSGAPGHLPPAVAVETPLATPGPPKSCIGQSASPQAVPQPVTSSPAVLALRGGTWVKQPLSGSGPVGLAAVTSDGAHLLAVDGSGRTWTEDGKSWRDAGSAPLSFAGGAALVDDSGRHVAVLVGGVPAPAVPTWEWDGSAWQLRAGTVPSPPQEPSILPAPAMSPSILPAPAEPPTTPPAAPRFTPMPPVP